MFSGMILELQYSKDIEVHSRYLSINLVDLQLKLGDSSDHVD